MTEHDRDVRVQTPRSVEERLRHVRECCRLLADLFALQAEVAHIGPDISFSGDGYNFLVTVVQTCADDLEQLVRDLPASVANWHGQPREDRP